MIKKFINKFKYQFHKQIGTEHVKVNLNKTMVNEFVKGDRDITKHSSLTVKTDLFGLNIGRKSTKLFFGIKGTGLRISKRIK